MSGYSLDSVPQFIAAGSPQRLRRLMLRNNMKHGMWFDYSTPQFNPVDRKWYVWFTQDLNQEARSQNPDLIGGDE